MLHDCRIKLSMEVSRKQFAQLKKGIASDFTCKPKEKQWLQKTSLGLLHSRCAILTMLHIGVLCH